MKHQALFPSKDKSKNIIVSSAAILLGALNIILRVHVSYITCLCASVMICHF